MKKPTILLIEDTLPLASVYKEYLYDEEAEVCHVASGAEAFDFLSEKVPEVVLLDVHLPDIDGMEILKHITEVGMDTTVVVITAHGSVSLAVDAMRLGAFEFLLKPFGKSRLVFTVRNALERMHLKHVVDSYKVHFERQEFQSLIGSSLPMQAVYKTIESVAPSNATVFIAGESGTGKDLCAQAIHNLSPRKGEEFVVLNCGAIPKDLMESEIFGHKKGAFTGAIDDRMGAAMFADKGTLFLDEIGEMDIDLQAKLLRFIQSGTFQRVGSNETITVDIRFLCATNRDPVQLIKEGRFREDLYYRLNVIPINMPPLRERGDDKLSIARLLLERFSNEEGRLFSGFSTEVEHIILNHPWPGNVRQLQNIIRNVVVLHDGPVVTKDMLPSPLNMFSADFPTLSLTDSREDIKTPFSIRPLWEQEKAIIQDAIVLCEGNIPKAAGHLDINPSTIYRKIKSWED